MKRRPSSVEIRKALDYMFQAISGVCFEHVHRLKHSVAFKTSGLVMFSMVLPTALALAVLMWKLTDL